MYIKIIRFFSETIGHIIVGTSGLIYINSLWKEPSEKAITVGLGALFVIAALSGLCFAMHPLLEDRDEKSTLLYAGEKYFHSCILIVQTIFLKYAFEQLLLFPSLSNASVHNSIAMVSQIILSILGGLATYFALYGFEELNAFLWTRYSVRWHAYHYKPKQ